MKNRLLLITDSYKSNLSNQIKKEYNSLILTINKTSIDSRNIKIIDGTGGKVSISDLIAYQIGWGKLLINWYKTGLLNEKPKMPGENFTKWDYVGLAKLFYEKYQFNNSAQQEEEFFKTVKIIINFTEQEFENQNLDKLGVWSWCTLLSGKKWSLSKWIKINTASPYKKASALINKLVIKKN